MTVRAETARLRQVELDAQISVSVPILVRVARGPPKKSDIRKSTAS